MTYVLLNETINNLKRVEKQKKAHKSQSKTQYNDKQLINLLVI